MQIRKQWIKEWVSSVYMESYLDCVFLLLQGNPRSKACVEHLRRRVWRSPAKGRKGGNR